MSIIISVLFVYSVQLQSLFPQMVEKSKMPLFLSPRTGLRSLKCDARHNGLGACLEQKIEPNVWAPIAFASRFLKNAEGKYSTNELELLAIVCSCEHFRTYLLGNRFQILTDHKAVISALNKNYNKKSYQSRLSRRADILLPFYFEVVHVPGVTLGRVDYISRYHTFTAPLLSQFDELFVVKSIEAFNTALNFINSHKERNHEVADIIPVRMIEHHKKGKVRISVNMLTFSLVHLANRNAG